MKTIRYKILRILPVIMLGLFLALSPPSKASAAGSDLDGTAGGGKGANTYLFYYEFDGNGVRLRVATTGGWPIDEFGGQTGHTFTKGDHTYIPASHPVCASAIDGPLAQMCATFGVDEASLRRQLFAAGYRENAGVYVAPGPTYLTYIDLWISMMERIQGFARILRHKNTDLQMLDFWSNFLGVGTIAILFVYLTKLEETENSEHLT